jgi:hypothetical protein
MISRMQEFYSKIEHDLKAVCGMAVSHIMLLENDLDEESRNYSHLEAMNKGIRVLFYSLKEKSERFVQEAKSIVKIKKDYGLQCYSCKELASLIIRIHDLILEDFRKIDCEFIRWVDQNRIFRSVVVNNAASRKDIGDCH